MPCSVTITVRSSSPNNDKAVSGFVTIHCSPEMSYSFSRVSQFLDMGEWNPAFMKASKFGNIFKSRGKLESHRYWQVQESWNKGTSISSETRKVPEYSHSVSKQPVFARWQVRFFWRVTKCYSAAPSTVPVPWYLRTGTLGRCSPGEKTWAGSGSGVSVTVCSTHNVTVMSRNPAQVITTTRGGHNGCI